MSEFLFRGEAERPAWSGYWWPMFISADRPAYRNLYDDDGPRAKYDRFCVARRLPSPRAKEFERWRYWSDTRMEQATGDKASPRSGAWTGASQNDHSDLPWRPPPLAVQNAAEEREPGSSPTSFHPTLRSPVYGIVAGADELPGELVRKKLARGACASRQGNDHGARAGADSLPHAADGQGFAGVGGLYGRLAARQLARDVPHRPAGSGLRRAV